MLKDQLIRLQECLSSIDILNMERHEMMEAIDLLNQINDMVKSATVSRQHLDPSVFVSKSAPQSELFMVEIIPIIHQLYFSKIPNSCIDVLDVGPQSFAGTSLLSRIHNKNSFSALKMNITAIDIHDKFLELKRLLCPEVDFLKSNIFNVKNSSWDLIVCSHVIEHVENPFNFIKCLKRLSRDYVIVACPWNEFPLKTGGHINTIGKDFVRKVGGEYLNIYTNYCWGKTREVCTFVLKGEAGHA